ncbi:receptor-like protein kinase FERONIA [Gossypium arboreum]|uniref:receptor-like protein kinase FERONIA n=1 Tax=Gossypium arboreum TaxID=29729 RepID=UPI0022F1AB11|nr:receptor-like protein kinase FERONIA [Gossypium arboreum]
MTARVSHSEFKYTFPVTLGQKFVLLYFHAASYKEYDRSKAFFPVKAGSFTSLKNFSASLVTNSKGRNWFPREFCLNVEDNEVLDLVFTPSRSASNDTYAFINGIEIVSMPTNLYYIQPDSQYVPFIGQRYPFPVENVTALEMAYRLNVGGQSLSPIDDTGLFRLWSDDFFYMTKNSYVTVNTSVPINYIMIQRYTAPEMVYRTARTIGPSLTYNEKHNLSWRLLVGSGFKYMVRLHFCEPQDLINSPGDRTFKVSINSQTAEENADVLMWTRHGRVPIFKDYVVFVSKEYITIDFILFIILSAKSKKRSLLIACVGCVASLITIISLLVCMVVRRQRKGTSWLCWWVNQNEGKSTRTSLLPDELCRYFSLDEIKATTNNFHDDLVVGKCGFGKVFKGFIDEGEKIVAIKRLNLESSQGIGEFLTEIEMLFQLRHVHLVSLIRYCNEKQEMILLYDFMSNGTLSDHLYSTSFAYDPLIWKQRLEICNGAVIGLNYLHTEVRHTIIHRDVKTSNILLDDKFTVKVSDFGLSKEDPKDEMLITGIKGTCGYMDPEYARGHKLT